MPPYRSKAWSSRLLDQKCITIAHALATSTIPRVVFYHVLRAHEVSENFIREFNGTSIGESLYH